MFSESNHVPAPLAAAVTTAVVVGLLHILAWAGALFWASARSGPSGMEIEDFFLPTSIMLVPGALYLLFGMRMGQKRRWAAIATLVVSACEGGLAALSAAAVLFAAGLDSFVLLAALFAAMQGLLIFHTIRVLRRWEDIAPPPGFAVLTPQAPSAPNPPADAECDQRIEP